MSPAEEIYQPRVMPQAAAPMPLTDARDYGAGVGDALDRAGAAVGRLQQAQHDRQQAEGAARIAEWSATTDAASQLLENDYTSGHVAAVDALVDDEQLSKLTDGITDPRVRRRMEQSFRTYAARQRGRAEVVQQVKEAGRTIENAGRVQSTLRNRVATASPDDVDAITRDSLGQWGTFSGGLAGISQDQAEKLGREGEADLLSTRDARMAEVDPDGVEGDLESRASLYSPEQIAKVQRAISLSRQAHEVAAREQQKAQAEAVTAEKKAAMDGLKAIKTANDNGDPPSLAQSVAAYQRARSAGFSDDELAEYRYVGEEAERARRLRAVSTDDLQGRQRALAQQEAAGRLDGAGGRELRQIGRTLDARAKNVGDTLEQQWKADPFGVAAQLRAMPAGERRLTATQLDPRALVLAEVPQGAIDRIASGSAFRKAQPTDYMPLNESDQPDPKAARQEFDAFLGPRLRRELGNSYSAVLETALDYYVGSQRRGGENAGWNRDNFRKAIRVVSGGSQRSDGTWQGGIDAVREKMVELPPLWNAVEFDRAWSGLDMAKHGAVYPNGQPVNNGDILTHFRPMFDHADPNGTSWYRFEDANGRSLPGKGGTFLMSLPRSPGRR